MQRRPKKPPENPLEDTPAPKWKSLRKTWDHERRMEVLMSKIKAIKEGTKPLPPAPEEGTAEAVAADVEKALALPAAHLPIFRLAHADMIGKSIEEDLSQSENPELRMDARAAGVKLISALIKAQKQMPTNQVNIQVVNTGDAATASQSQGRSRPQPGPRTPPTDPDAPF